jgi:hypothetical protein
MSRLLYGLLEALGRFRLRLPGLRSLSVGEPTAVDAQGGSGWQAFAQPEALYRVWGPLEDGPWEPYHCVPLFAALDRVPRRRLGPTDPKELEREDAATPQAGAFRLPPYARPGSPPPGFIDAATWTMLDLPGRASVQAAVWLVTAGVVQPVCTFDHWPHPRGLLRADRILAELLRWATTVADARGRIPTGAPPLWICDSERLGTRHGGPGEFDNRYYLDDSILPGPGLLARHGIRRVVYVSSGQGDIPLLDLERYFGELLAAGIDVLHVDLRDPLMRPLPFTAPARPRAVPKAGFRRSAAGGFGTEVPQPSSGGSSG